MQTILPCGTLMLKVVTLPGTERSSTTSAARPSAFGGSGYISTKLRPSIMLDQALAVDLGDAAGRHQLAVAHHAHLVADRNTSASRWVM